MHKSQLKTAKKVLYLDADLFRIAYVVYRMLLEEFISHKEKLDADFGSYCGTKFSIELRQASVRMVRLGIFLFRRRKDERNRSEDRRSKSENFQVSNSIANTHKSFSPSYSCEIV